MNLQMKRSSRRTYSFITAAGGVLKCNCIFYISRLYKRKFCGTLIIGIVVPVLLSAILKTAQGSSTVAILQLQVIAPMMTALGLGTPMLAADA